MNFTGLTICEMIDIKHIFLLLEADKPIYFAKLIMLIFFPVIHAPPPPPPPPHLEKSSYPILGRDLLFENHYYYIV